MVEFAIEMTGGDQSQLAHELGDRLTAAQGEVRVFVEPEKDLDPIATVSVAFAGIQAAGIIWA